jgi:hypothetical protein
MRLSMKRPLETRRPARNRGLGRITRSAALTPALNVLPHLRNGLARLALSDFDDRAALAALPAVLARILPGGKRGGAELVARKPHQHPAHALIHFRRPPSGGRRINERERER